jgi:putative exosortase-associated protein (TIGR04073 family)
MTSRIIVGTLAASVLGATLALPPLAAADTAPDKLGRGLAGMVAGVAEVPGNMKVEIEDRGPAAGTFVGFVKGIGMVVVREVTGVYEFVTAPLPVPEGYRPVLQPEYPWAYFDGTTASARAPRRS